MATPTPPERDPFAPHRADGGTLEATVSDLRFPMVLGYDAVRSAARDWRTFSSDAPFRVPIPHEHDVRSVRQLPIEVDPPDHGEYRRIVDPVFGRSRAERIRPTVTAAVDDLLDELVPGPVEVVRELALPVQSTALGHLLGRPDDVDRWISWGVHVFRDGGGHGDELDAYLCERIAEARRAPGADLFGLLATASFHGRPLTDDEMLGLANLTFAGGRDTVITMIAETVAHLAAHPDDHRALRADPSSIPTAVEELVRFVSPLTHIGRIATTDVDLDGRAVAADDLVSLCFASANRDATVFDRADECVLDRRPNRHVAFGHGPHTCLGAPLARMVLAVVLDRLVARLDSISIDVAVPSSGGPEHQRRRVGYRELVAHLHPADHGAGSAATSNGSFDR